MKSKQIDESPKTFILVFETGDELAKGLLEFAEQEKLSAASFKAVGALSFIRGIQGARAPGFGDDGEVVVHEARVSVGQEALVTEVGYFRFY
jgi:hypothetical protein